MQGTGMNLKRIVAMLCFYMASFSPAWSQAEPAQKAASVASTINRTWSMIEGQFVSAAEAMPEDKYSFTPTAGEFKGARSFAQQVRHVACANYAFFNEIEGKKPPDDCEHGGDSPAKTKTEIMQYLRESFKYADQVLATVDTKNILSPVDGPYGGPSTKLGIAVLAVWHASDHYGQLVEYLRMNGIIPPASR
jgi:uncharacterized damage-inducible protein DinB